MTPQQMVDQMRTRRPGISIRVRCGRRGTGWRATCRAGFADGAHPIWARDAETRNEAIAKAVEDAWSYWVRARSPG